MSHLLSQLLGIFNGYLLTDKVQIITKTRKDLLLKTMFKRVWTVKGEKIKELHALSLGNIR